MDTPHERLRAARKQAGFSSASEAAQALGIPVGTYLGHENGSRAFDVEAAKKYSRRFKVTLTWLLTGDGPMKTVLHERGGTPDNVPAKVRAFLEQHDPDALSRHNKALENLEHQFLAADAESWEGEHPDHPDDSVGVYVEGVPYRSKLPGGRPEIDARMGAGEGQVGDLVVTTQGGNTYTGHRVTDEWVFPEAFFRHELHAAANFTIIQPVIGSSMEPTLQSGDRVIVDTSQNRFGQDAIYVFDDGDGEPRVKRFAKVLFSERHP